MDFFSESPDGAINSGVMGLEITLRTKEMSLTDSLVEFVSPFKSPCGEVEHAFDLSFLSKTKAPLGLYYACHGHIVDQKLQHFLITLRRKPKAVAPEEIQRTSDALGGFPGGLQKLWSVLGEQQVNWRASLRLAIVKPKRWSLKLERQKLPSKVGSFRLEEQELRFKNTKDRMDAVLTFAPGINEYVFQINSVIEAKFNASCLDEVSEQLWGKAKSLFDRK